MTYRLRIHHVFAIAVCGALACGCGSGLEGTYSANARLLEGQEDLMKPGYSLSEIQARIGGGQRTLTLLRGGRYEWRTGGDGLNLGTWRVEGKSLILRDDNVGGVQILPALQDDRIWEIRANGEIVNTGSYSAYNIEEYYTPN